MAHPYRPVVAATVLYLLLADVALETFWSRSPVRWWVVSAVSVYATATFVLWNRGTWNARTRFSLGVLLAIAAATAWLPDGLTNGLRVLGLSTGTALSVIAAGGVTFGTTVLVRLPRLRQRARWLVGALGAYGVSSFLQGAFAGTPFAAMMSGESLWRSLPYAFQGSVVGGLMVLPLGLLVSAVRSGLRAPAPSSRLHAIRQTAALTATCAVVVAGLRPSVSVVSSSPPAGDRVGSGRSIPSGQRLALLDNSLRAVEEGLRESPRDTWDPGYVVERLGTDPQVLLEWVRDHTSWVPYRGLLRGAPGVLMDGLGNSLDTAVLLATLLTGAGHRVRLVRGELTEDQARVAFPRVARASLPLESHTPLPDIESDARLVTTKYGLDASVVRTLATHATLGLEQIAETQSIVREQADRVRELLGASDRLPDPQARLDLAMDQLRDHWWVQRSENSQWIDMDPSLDDSQGLLATPVLEVFDPKALPQSLVHTVTVRVVAEHVAESQLRQSTVLQHTLHPADLLGKRAVLQIWPAGWPVGMGSGVEGRATFRSSVLDQSEWLVTLKVGRDPVASSVIRATDPVAGSGQRSESPMGGLGAGLARSLEDKGAPGAQLSALWLEYEIAVPRMAPRLIRRALFDLPGPAARAANLAATGTLREQDRLERGLALMRETEILVLACELSPQFVLSLLGHSLLENRELMRSAISAADAPRLLDLARGANPPPTALLGLALSRFAWSRFRSQIFVDRPVILTRHSFLESTDGRIFWRAAIDVVANELGVDALAKDPFSVRLAQGVLDTNLEALHGAESVPIAGTAQAFNVAGSHWIALRKPGDAALQDLRLSDDQKRRIVEDLDAGYVVVAMRDPVSLHARNYVGWWRVDPSSGHSLGMDANGWGGAQTFAEYAKAFLQGGFSEFFMCEGLHEFVAQTRDGLELGAGATSGFGVCVVGALAAGFMATLPILVVHIHTTVTSKALRLPPAPILDRRILHGRFPAQYDDGYPRLAGIEWPRNGPDRTPLMRSSAGTAQSQQLVDEIIAETKAMQASVRARFDEAMAEFRAAATRSEATKHLPSSDPERMRVLAAEESAGQKMNLHRQVVEGEERRLQYWTEIRPVNDQLVKAVAERDAAVARYNRRLFNAPLEGHLETTIDAIEAQARVRQIQQHIDDIAWGRVPKAALPDAPAGPKSPMTTTLGGVAGASNSM